MKRNENLSDEVQELRYDLIDLKNKFLELCEIVNDLPNQKSSNRQSEDFGDINSINNNIHTN